MDIATKEILLPWITAGMKAALVSLALCLFLCCIPLTRKSMMARLEKVVVPWLCASLFVLFIGTGISMSWTCDIRVFELEDTLRYMTSVDAADWSLNNNHAKIFKVDGKTFLIFHSGKYEIETTTTRDFFVRTLGGELVYAVNSQGEIIKF